MCLYVSACLCVYICVYYLYIKLFVDSLMGNLHKCIFASFHFRRHKVACCVPIGCMEKQSHGSCSFPKDGLSCVSFPLLIITLYLKSTEECVGEDNMTPLKD